MGILLWDSGLLLWITHCWCCVLLMCNARGLEASVAAFGAQLMYENVLESIFSTF